MRAEESSPSIHVVKFQRVLYPTARVQPFAITVEWSVPELGEEKAERVRSRRNGKLDSVAIPGFRSAPKTLCDRLMIGSRLMPWAYP